MKIDHIALYTSRLEELKAFYETHFGGVAGDKYHNPNTGLSTYFLQFEGGSRLELMSRPDMGERAAGYYPSGLVHVAFSVGGREEVDKLTKTLVAEGCTLVSGPRVTGDGYYESCVADPDGNLVEITV